MISRIAILSIKITFVFSIIYGKLLLEILLVGFSLVSSATVHRCRVAGTSCTNGCARGRGRAPHWSCENYAAESLQPKLPVRTLPSAPPAYPRRCSRHFRNAPTLRAPELQSPATPTAHLPP